MRHRMDPGHVRLVCLRSLNRSSAVGISAQMTFSEHVVRPLLHHIQESGIVKVLFNLPCDRVTTLCGFSRVELYDKRVILGTDMIYRPFCGHALSTRDEDATS
jgi:hypothetical protein